jgi:hypothetical protein
MFLLMGQQGCDNQQDQKEPYIEKVIMNPQVATPKNDITVTYTIKNPKEFDTQVYLEIDISNGLQRMSSPYNRLSLGTIVAGGSKSFYSVFRLEENINSIQQVNITLYPTPDTDKPIDIKKVPIEVASIAG